MFSIIIIGTSAVLCVFLLHGVCCAATENSSGPKPASPATKAANANLKTLLDFGDNRDFEEATRGFIAPLPDGGVIRNAAGEPVWDMPRFAFIEQIETAPETVNPKRSDAAAGQPGLLGPDEIADNLAFPASLQAHWAMRGYSGTLRHNAKSTSVKYLGWFDGNPSKRNVLPPQAAAKQYAAYMGGAAAVMEKARQDFAQGEYRCPGRDSRLGRGQVWGVDLPCIRDANIRQSSARPRAI